MATDVKRHPFIHPRSRRLHLVIMLMAAFFCLGQMTSHIGLSLSCMCNSTAVALLSNASIDKSEDLQLDLNASTSDESCTRLQGRTVKDYGGSFVWSVKTQGNIVTATFVGGFLFAYPAGFAVDRLSARHLLSLAIFVLSLMSLSMPLLVEQFGATSAIVVRFIMGISDALLLPSLNSMITKWIPLHEKSTAAALFTSGNQFAGIIGTPIVAELCASPLGWPAIFYSGAVFGFVWLAVWHFAIRNSPHKSRWIHERELDYLENHLPKRALGLPKKRTPWKSMLTSSAFWALMYSSILGNMMIALVFVYIPVYFKDVLMLDVQANGFYSSIPNASNLFAKIAWGMWMDRMKRNGTIHPTTACKLSQFIAMMGIAISCFVLRYLDCSTPIAALILLSGVSASFGLSISGFYTSLLSIAPSHIGALTGVSTVIGFTGRIFTPQLISYFKTIGTAEEWGNVLLVYAVMSSICAVVFVLFGSEKAHSTLLTSFHASHFIPRFSLHWKRSTIKMASRTTKDQLECRLREMEQKVKEQTAEINSLNDTIRELKVDNREKADVIHEFKEVCSELRKCLADARQKSYAEAASTPKPHEPMTSPLAYAMQAQKALRSREEHEKDLTVVAIGVPESTDENLQEAVQEILGAKGISSDVVEKVWRHGERKDNKNRVVKIKLRNDYNHRLIKYTIGSSSFCRYARNDLSYEELAEDRRLRNYARELNRKEGSYTYVVRDLTIVKKKNPTPFTPFEEQVQEESGYKTVSNSPQ